MNFEKYQKYQKNLISYNMILSTLRLIYLNKEFNLENEYVGKFALTITNKNKV